MTSTIDNDDKETDSLLVATTGGETSPSPSLYGSSLISQTYSSEAQDEVAPLPTRHNRTRSHVRTGSLGESLLFDLKDAADAFIEEVQDATDAFIEEVQDATEAFIEEVQEVADVEQEDNFFLDMGLVRGLSILPVDMVDAAEKTAPTAVTDEGESPDVEATQPFDNKQEAVTTPSTPMHAYLLLLTAVVALSSIGPLLNLQNRVDPVMKVYWRMSATAMMLFPFAVSSVKKEGLPKLSISQALTVFLAAASYAAMNASFVVSLKYTAIGNAVIFSNSQALILLLAKLFVGDQILLQEAFGALVAFSGAILCSRDSMSSAPEGSDKTLFGDLIALLSALLGVWYLVFAKSVRSHVSLYPFMFIIMACGSSLVLLFMYATGVECSLDRHITHGMFGWMNLESDRLPLELTMVIVCNMLGAMGYVRAMHFFDNLVISVAALSEPIVAELTAVALGVGFMPGPLGWTGNCMVLVGTAAVVMPSKSS